MDSKAAQSCLLSFFNPLLKFLQPYSSGNKKWFNIDWQQATVQVKQQQQAIAVAYKEGNLHKVNLLQHQLVCSFSRKRVAVKTVTSNKGKNTPGVDNIVWNTPELKYQAILDLNPNNSNYVAKPVKRVYIPKKNGKLRPLGIPCMGDRAMQTLWKFALEPIAECTRDIHSYGFRPNRSRHDGMTFLWLLCSGKHHPNWVLEGDIKGFYDNIHHEWIMENIPMNKAIQKRFQKAGFIEKQQHHETLSGVPQGGSISPTIANMTLDGLEEVVKATANDILGKIQKKANKKTSTWVHVIRYADDFIVTGVSSRMLQGPIKRTVTAFLQERGLALNEEKTHITSLWEGFDFLGFNSKFYKNRYKPNGHIFQIKPAKRNIKKLKSKLKEVFRDKNLDVLDLIQILNPILMGWANYFNKVISRKVFQHIDFYLWFKIMKWRKQKHPTWSGIDIYNKYFTKVGDRKWIFHAVKGKKKFFLYQIRKTPIVRHGMIKKGSNFYLPEEENATIKQSFKISNASIWGWKTKKIGMKTKFVCKVCNTSMAPHQSLDIHHILPKKLGGADNFKNLILLHRECHKQVTHTKNAALQAQFKKMGILKDLSFIVDLLYEKLGA